MESEDIEITPANISQADWEEAQQDILDLLDRVMSLECHLKELEQRIANSATER